MHALKARSSQAQQEQGTPTAQQPSQGSQAQGSPAQPIQRHAKPGAEERHAANPQEASTAQAQHEEQPGGSQGSARAGEERDQEQTQGHGPTQEAERREAARPDATGTQEHPASGQQAMSTQQALWILDTVKQEERGAVLRDQQGQAHEAEVAQDW